MNRDAVSFSLELPPAPAYLGTVRMFVGSVARSFGVGEDLVDDCKVAVSEACASAIRLREGDPDPPPMRVSAHPADGRLVFEIQDATLEGGPEPAGSTTEDLIRSLGLEVIHALFPDVETVDGSDGFSTIRVRVPTGE